MNINGLTLFSTELIPVYTTDTGNQVVIGRELHERLEAKKKYSDWFKQMSEYFFEEGKDFFTIWGNNKRGRKSIEHIMTFDMAKEIALLQKTEIGKNLRLQLIELEKKFHKKENLVDEIPEDILLAKALLISDQRVKALEMTVEEQTIQIQGQAKELEEAEPKLNYYNKLVDDNYLSTFREAASLFGVPERKFIEWLIKEGYIYRDSNNQLKPYSQYLRKGYFETKNRTSTKSSWTGIQTYITMKGRARFQYLLEGVTL